MDGKCTVTKVKKQINSCNEKHEKKDMKTHKTQSPKNKKTTDTGPHNSHDELIKSQAVKKKKKSLNSRFLEWGAKLA